MAEEMSSADICRVCRSEGLPDRPLFHPCICTGSIKWIHQECLVQWMRYSRKEFCELCGYRFSFTPIYSPDMPRRLPLRDVLYGILTSVVTAVKYWLHYTLVAIAWLGIVPLTACRTYRVLFSGSFDLLKILTLPMEILSTENISSDIFHGCFVVTCTLIAFIGLVWLREQILNVGGPEWIDRNVDPPVNNVEQALQNDAQLDDQRPAGNDNNNVPPFVNEPPREEVINQGDANMIANEEMAELVEHRQGEIIPEGGQGNALGLGGIWRAAQVQGDQAQGEAEEANWNPMDWDRPVEELTWERLLGLDGSLLFLEHVFWIISLNTLFIMVFAFCPYHIGNLAIVSLGFQDHAVASHFEGLVTTLCGYCVIGVWLVVLHTLAAIVGFQRSQRILGLCYVVVKVSLLSVVEIGVLPSICGWWLDICSLAMFDATLRDREASFKHAPSTSMFIHWLAGMVYIYYFASFILLLREVLRPGVLWFLRNLDPDFSPIQEMIHLPILTHVRRLVASAIIFGTAILLMVWVPVRILKWAYPGFLPYMVAVQSEAPMSELSLELVLLHVILPALLEQSHTRIWLKALIKTWCRVVAWMLNLQSYLLRNETEETNAVAEEPQPIALGAVHQAMLQREGPMGFQPYVRPVWFLARLLALLLCICASLVVISLAAMTVPVWIGRKLMVIWTASGTASPAVTLFALENNATTTATESSGKVHEVYTVACGSYVCWAVSRGLGLAISWLPRGRRAIIDKIKNWAVIGLKATVAFVLLVGVIPLLFGLLLELVIVVPLRVPLEQNPILFIWQDWALGVLYTKIATAVTMMGPEGRFRLAIERAYNDGIRDMDLRFIVMDIAAPVICCFGLVLAVPYVVAHSIVPLFVTNLQTQIIIARRIYPFLLLVNMACMVVTFQIRQFKKLYEHIKNDKYLVGQRLVNYEHRNRPQAQQMSS